MSSERTLKKYLLLLLLPWSCLIPTALEAAPHPIRVLFLGHVAEHHNSAIYVPILMQKLGREAIYFDYFTTPDCLNKETLAPYDAVMLYANHEKITPEQFEALNAFVESGRGFLPIHCASACFGNEPRFIALVGGRFKSHQTGVFKATILLKTHPIFQGVKEYETWDETYVHDQLNPQGTKILMDRAEGARREPWTWIREQGAGRVFYTASGHDERTWGNADFQQMLRNAIVWAVGDKVRVEWQAFLAQREPEKRDPNRKVTNYEKRQKPITFQNPFTVKGSIDRTQVPADMRLEIFAAEPQIAKPIAMAWDERGRLWIAETHDYPHGVTPEGVGHDDIKICEDLNGDGKADKFTVFADKLNIPTSLVFARGGVIVTQAGRFLYLKDTNGDDKADVREVIIQGWGTQDTHAQANNLHYGFDNSLYGCVGYAGFKGSVGGKTLSFAMGTYRFKADGSALEFLHQFSNNSWGQSQNVAGDQFGGTANNAPIFYGGIPATILPEGTKAVTAKKINVQDKVHAITPNYRQVDVMGGYTAAAGSAFIYSAKLPPRLQGMAMVCEPTMKVITLMDVQPKGAGYVAKDGFNLVASSDEWMSPVFAEVGPDGAVWFADWQNFVIQHNPTPSVANGGFDAKTGPGGAYEDPVRDHNRGRIYRVVWNNPAAVPFKPLPATAAKQTNWTAALQSDNPFWRLTAQRMLVENQVVAAVPALKELVLKNDGALAAVHALWSLQGLGQLDEETHKAALAAKDPVLRRNAVRALGVSKTAATLFFSSKIIDDPDPVTRLAAMVKLAQLPVSPEMGNVVASLVADPAVKADEWLAEAAKVLAAKSDQPVEQEGPNLLPNPGFETVSGNGLPQGWTRRDYGQRVGTKAARWQAVAGPGNAHGGTRSVQCVTMADADTSLFADVALKPNTKYKLSGWVRGRALSGRVRLNDNIGRAETDSLTSDSDWREVSVTFNSGPRTTASINVLHVAKGAAFFDDVKLCELMPAPPKPVAVAAPALVGDVAKGEAIFRKHPAVSCIICHSLKGEGSSIGPPLDGIATRGTPEYMKESLLEPNKKLAKGYEAAGISSMPPMGAILSDQEIADVIAFLQTLK